LTKRERPINDRQVRRFPAKAGKERTRQMTSKQMFFAVVFVVVAAVLAMGARSMMNDLQAKVSAAFTQVQR